MHTGRVYLSNNSIISYQMDTSYILPLQLITTTNTEYNFSIFSESGKKWYKSSDGKTLYGNSTSLNESGYSYWFLGIS